MSESKNVGIGTISATDSDETSRNVGMGSVAVVGGTGGGVTPEELEQGLATKQDVLTAGSGISLSNNTVSVDTSVVATQSDLTNKQDKLTAGSGIALSSNTVSANISTLTTDQITALKKALGVDETVLWEGAASSPVTSITCSVAPSSFNTIKVYWTCTDYTHIVEYPGSISIISYFGSTDTQLSSSTVTTHVYFASFSISSKTVTAQSCGRYYVSVNSGGSHTVTQNTAYGNDWARSWRITKIVGINRK